MDESEVLVDSMYEIDAPRVIDFDTTIGSVNESIFEKTTVGEKKVKKDDSAFASPAAIFRDIGNITPRLLRSSSKTPKTNLPELHSSFNDNKTPRIVTRSMTKSTPFLVHSDQCSDALRTPSVSDITPIDNRSLQSQRGPHPQCTIALDNRDDKENESADSEENVKMSQGPSLVNTNSAENARTANTSGGAKMNLETENKKSMRASTGNLSSSSHHEETKLNLRTRRSDCSIGDMKNLKGKSTVRSPPKLRHGKTANKSTSHLGIPFAGKTALRVRTRSCDSSLSSTKATAPDSSTQKKASVPTQIRHRTASAGPAGVPTLKNSKHARSTSQTNVASGMPTSSLLSRLMKPTTSTLQKSHIRKDTNVSPSKRRNSQTGENKPPKVPKSTVPKTPQCLKRKAKLTPAKSSEDIQLEAIEQEKQALMVLKKLNRNALTSMPRSGRKKKPSEEIEGGRGSTNNNIYKKPPRAILTDSKSHPPSNHDKPPTIYTKLTSTIPHSPKFLTSLRERTKKVLTQQEREEQELQKMRSMQFKAAPLNKKIFENPQGIKSQETLPVTEPLNIKFATDQRVARHEERNADKNKEHDDHIVKSKPPPKNSTIFQPVLSHKATKPLPFTFEGKQLDMKKRREELLKKVEEEEKKRREFKANPLPASPRPLPEKPVLPPTVPVPFQLQIDERGQRQQERFKRQLEQERVKMLEATIVHAKPADVLKKQPFKPVKLPPKVTAPINVELNLERRAEERHHYQLRKRELERQAQELEERARQRKEEEDQAELMRLRKETVIRPAPIKNYKPVVIQPSEKKLTQPKSPNFSKK